MDISAVSWIYNCEDTINELYERLTETLEGVGLSYEIIFVNDASKDNSWKEIKALNKKDPHVKAINFRRHYGQSAGLQAAFDIAKGKYVFTISPTLENKPEDLAKFITKMEKEDYDMLIGFRKSKLKGRFYRGMLSSLANSVISLLVGQVLRDMTSPFRLVRREVLTHMKIYGDHHLFLPAIATLYGAKFGEIEIAHGKPKNKSFVPHKIRFVKTAFDLLVLKFLISISTPPFSMTPMRVFGIAGIISFIFGFGAGSYLTIQKLIYGYEIGSRPLLLLSVMMIILGVLFVVLGILGELIVRVYFEGQNKKTYSVREHLS